MLSTRFAPLVTPLATFAIALAVTLLIRQLAVRTLYRRINGQHPYTFVLLRAVRFPSILWCIAAAIGVALRFADLTRAQEYWAIKAIGAFLIVSISLVIASVGARMIGVYGERSELAFALSGLSRTLTQVVVWSVGGLMLLRHFDISITPLLTALGVGGLAVALALQDTLANFFAGVHILVEEPIMLGHHIRLSTGEEGVVRDIGWRTTRIQSAGNNIIVIPNTKITSGILTNYTMHDKRAMAEIAIFAAHDADPALIASLAIEAAAATGGVLPEPAPVVYFDPGITQTHMQLKLIVQVPSIAERPSIQSAIRARLFEAMRQHNIPFPAVRP